MARALALARRAARAGEVPVGAVLVSGDELVASGRNRTIADRDPTAHAEIVALRRAARKLGNPRLTGTTLYVTVEPCILCVGALVQARVARVVFGCHEPKAGALGSVYPAEAHARLNHRFRIRAGVRAEECRQLLREFFRQRREEKKKAKGRTAGDAGT
ncbi:MAG: hypothetical protein KatS3mg076_2625 [Candidatus Binatia bacterium]|nr:MAG: hypothetical protein KatS3mg076_2625 [Candidatus Binatia bacterium]